MNKSFKLSNQELAYLILRIGLGVNFMMHALVRLPNFEKFQNFLSSQFSNFLPEFLIFMSSYLITGIELIGGLFFLVGLFSRFSLVFLGLLMTGLMFGMCLLQDWNAVAMQLIYLVAIYFALEKHENNKFFVC